MHLVVPDKAKPRAKRAVKAAVNYLGLNRETLTRSRYVVYDDLQFALFTWQEGNAKGKMRAEGQIQRMCKSDRQYAAMSRFFAREAGFPV